MLKIRLQRVGRRNDPSFRVVVTDSHKGPKAGRHVEIVGSYNPKSGDVQLNEESIKARIAHGAQVSGTLHNMLVSKGVIEGKKINVLPKKSPIANPDASDGSQSEPASDGAGEGTLAEAPAAEAPAEEVAAAPAEEAPAEGEAKTEEEKQA